MSFSVVKCGVASRRVASRRVVSCRVVLCGVCCVVGGWRWGWCVVWCGVVWWLEGSSTAVQILQPWCCNGRMVHLNDTISSLLLSPTELVRGPCSSFMPKHADADSARASNTLASVHLQNCWDRLRNCVPTLKIKTCQSSLLQLRGARSAPLLLWWMPIAFRW